MTKIDIISGFLGAGKTTFIQKLLSDALKGENVVLIENEFGEIGVDSGFLKNAGIEIREMNQGCICCSLVGDFESSLKEVIEQYHPDRILIEPSGVGKLSDILSAVKTVSENLDVKLDGAVTVVDATKAKLYNKNFGEFFDDQIRFATSVVLSRMDIASGEKAQEAVNIVRGINPHANLITTALTELSGEKLLEIIGKEENLEEELLAEVKAKAAHHHEHHHDHEHHHEHHHEHGESCGCGFHDEEEHEHHHHHEHEEHEHHHDHEHGEGCCCGHDHEHEEHEHHHHDHEHGESCGCGHHHEHGHHHADEVFQSIGMETSHKFSEAEINDFLGKLGNFTEFGTILRAKGVVENAEGGWIHFDYVPGEPDIRTGSAATTGMICVIGVDIEEANIREALAL